MSYHLQHFTLCFCFYKSLNNGVVWVKRLGRFSLWIHSCWGRVILLFVFPLMGLSFFILICWKFNNLAVNTFLASLLYDTNGWIFYYFLFYTGVLCIIIFECFTWLPNSTLCLNYLSFLVYILLPNVEL